MRDVGTFALSRSWKDQISSVLSRLAVGQPSPDGGNRILVTSDTFGGELSADEESGALQADTKVTMEDDL